MANMLDYLDWRGDLTFEQSPFNEVDNLILSQMCYAPFERILDRSWYKNATSKKHYVAKGELVLTVKEAADRFFSLYSPKRQQRMESQQIRATKVLERMGASNRFQNCNVGYYFSQTDLKEEKQFAALTVELGPDVVFVAYRGTDNTLVGWKEDFNMSYMSHVQAQKDALTFFELIAKEYPNHKFFLGGHSKGGNLAVYASVMCSQELKKRIIRVYNNDGPGFRKDIIESEQYQQILPKVRTIVPESSIVGLLYGHQEEYTIIRSSQTGGMQHDATSWEVLGNHFIYLEQLSEESRKLDTTITAWLSDLTTEQMKITVDAIFLVLMEAGFSTVSAIQKEPLRNAIALIRKMKHLDPETRKNITAVVKVLVRERNRTMRNKMRDPEQEEER
ncbi:MAG: DUF2974 domain-containing protein [Lachnospiraceae bacterium]